MKKLLLILLIATSCQAQKFDPPTLISVPLLVDNISETQINFISKVTSHRFRVTPGAVDISDLKVDKVYWVWIRKGKVDGVVIQGELEAFLIHPDQANRDIIDTERLLRLKY